MLCIQDPRYSNSMLLHEALLNAAENALYGAGVYAFASADGAMLLLEDTAFSEFLHRGRFSLIVGIDEITTPKALAIIEKKPLKAIIIYWRQPLFIPLITQVCFILNLVGSDMKTVGP